MTASDARATSELLRLPPPIRIGESESLLLAGALGGPFTIWLYTPLRNGITLGSQAPCAISKPASSLYRDVFSRGFAGGWTGCTTTVAVSSVQFLVMGPLYHVYSSKVGTILAVGAGAFANSTEHVIRRRYVDLLHYRCRWGEAYQKATALKLAEKM